MTLQPINHPINAEIENELKKRGFNRITPADNRASVNNFELFASSHILFKEIYNKPFLRMILQLISNKANKAIRERKPDIFPMNKEDIRLLVVNYKEKLKSDVIDCPEKKLLCYNCHHKTVIIPYNIYFNQKPSHPLRCPVCHLNTDPNQCEEEDDWSFFEEKYFLKFIAPFIGILEENKIISTYLLGTCFKCHKSNQEPLKELSKDNLNLLSKTGLKKYIKNFYCGKCNRFYDFEQMINFEEKQKEFWIKKGGTWFEWYIKNLIKINNSTIPIEQGIQVINGNPLEIDIILLKNNKLITIQCKATNPDLLKFEQIADVIKLKPFSDEIYLVTTAMISEPAKKELLNICGEKLKIISGKKIESEVQKI